MSAIESDRTSDKVVLPANAVATTARNPVSGMTMPTIIICT